MFVALCFFRDHGRPWKLTTTAVAFYDTPIPLHYQTIPLSRPTGYHPHSILINQSHPSTTSFYGILNTINFASTEVQAARIGAEGAALVSLGAVSKVRTWPLLGYEVWRYDEGGKGCD